MARLRTTRGSSHEREEQKDAHTAADRRHGAGHGLVFDRRNLRGWCQSLCRFANCDTRVLKPTFWSQSFMGLTLRHRGLRIALRISAPRSPAVTTLLLTRTIRLRRDCPEADRANIVRWSRATQQGRQNRAPRRRSNETAIALATGLPHATFARGGTRGARWKTATVCCQVSLTVCLTREPLKVGRLLLRPLSSGLTQLRIAKRKGKGITCRVNERTNDFHTSSAPSSDSAASPSSTSSM